ncbi:hypothetical protein BN1088_1431981 [Sphingobacterium sp. PM2-P1-29]|nr:hypothetical protein BN1088_1431981 [Sphingobacterium sp. PM2-P1-29]
MMLHSVPNSAFNKYFMAFGKSLAIAEKFETTCKFILQTALIESELKSKNINFYDLFDPNSKKGKKLRKLTNGGIAKYNGPAIVKNGIISEFVISKLTTAIDSRNWLAHSSMVGIAYSFGEGNTLREFDDALIDLEKHVINIAIGEYICGSIEYEINNKVPYYDSDQQDYYASKIKDWVLDYDGKIASGFNILQSYFYEIKKAKSKPATY